MALGTGPQRLQSYIETNYQSTRSGRGDLPPIIKYATSGEDPKLNEGVLVLRDREDVAVDHAKHDLIHAYHPEGNPPQYSDQGYREVNIVESVQLDISVTDRTDHTRSPGDQRLSARERLVGLRGDDADTSDAPYPGLLGEVQYVLEETRRGLDEWDTVSMDVVNLYLGNSNADASVLVELERIATNTVV